MVDDIDDDEFVDPNDYQGGKEQGVTFNQIILQHIRRCVEAGSKTMTGGFVKQVQTKDGTKDVYVEDQREVYINCIKSFYDIMLPYADKPFYDEDKKFKEQIKKISDDTINMLVLQKDWAEKNGLTEQKKQLEHNIATKTVDPDSYEAKTAMDSRLDAYRLLYQALINLYVRVVGEGADIND